MYSIVVSSRDRLASCHHSQVRDYGWEGLAVTIETEDKDSMLHFVRGAVNIPETIARLLLDWGQGDHEKRPRLDGAFRVAFKSRAGNMGTDEPVYFIIITNTIIIRGRSFINPLQRHPVLPPVGSRPRHDLIRGTFSAGCDSLLAVWYEVRKHV